MNDFQKSRAAQILGCYKETDLEKGGGEGSRGGKVVGHTKSGNPIYANNDKGGLDPRRDTVKDLHMTGKMSADEYKELKSKGIKDHHYVTPEPAEKFDVNKHSKAAKEEDDAVQKFAGGHSIKNKDGGVSFNYDHEEDDDRHGDDPSSRQYHDRVIKGQEDDLKKSELNKAIEAFEELEKGEAFEELLKAYDSFDKSDDGEDVLVKSYHKYIKKIGDKYIYNEPEERKVSSINELREYHGDKTSLDKLHGFVSGAAHSEENRESYKTYNKKKADFEGKYGHAHDSEDATHRLRMTRAGMMNHINNKVKEIESKQNSNLNSELDSIEKPKNQEFAN